MLYVLFGADIEKGREKLHQTLSSLLKKRPDASVFRLTAEDISAPKLEDLAGAQGLFSAKHITVLDQPFESAEAKDVVFTFLPSLQSSQNIFILFTGELDAKTKAILQKQAEKVTEFGKAKQAEKVVFNRFSLPDALGRRDRKVLWVLYQKAKQAALSDEEIHGLLFWQVKSMLLASRANTAEDAGLKPFVFSKARTFLKNYSEEELKQLSRDLVTLYHEARRGVCDFSVALERFVLSV